MSCYFRPLGFWGMKKMVCTKRRLEFEFRKNGQVIGNLGFDNPR